MIPRIGVPPSGAPFALYLDDPMLRGLLATFDAAEPPRETPGANRAHQALFRLIGAADKLGGIHRPGGLDELADLRPGELVEVSGTAYGNPLIRVLTFVAAVMPVVDPLPEPGKSRPSRASPGSPRPVPEHEQVQRVLNAVVDAATRDLRANAVVDVLVAGAPGFVVVLTLDRAILGTAGEALLDDRSVRVIGKVSSVLDPSRPLNLFRRSLLAATSAQASRQMLAELSEGGLDLEMADPILEGPGLEILPLAVLI
jgi:hypothetical protein